MTEIKNERVGTFCNKCQEIICICNKEKGYSMKFEDTLIELNSRMANLSNAKGRMVDMLADAIVSMSKETVSISRIDELIALKSKYEKIAKEMGFTIDWVKSILIK